MSVRATEIGDLLRQQIAGFQDQMTVTNVGTVASVRSLEETRAFMREQANNEPEA